MTTVGRLAPSPTGVLHLGNVRTFLWAWLAARSAGGRVILRVEDLEKPLSGFVLEEMLSDLAWLGFDWDEGPVWTAEAEAALAELRRFPKARARAGARAAELSASSVPAESWVSAVGLLLPFAGTHAPYIQSRRGAAYRAVFERLRADGAIYPCTCERADFAGNLGAPHDGEAEPRYPGTCRGRWPDEAAARSWLSSRAGALTDGEAAIGGFSNAWTRAAGEPVWRFRVPDGDRARVEFADWLRGLVAVDVAATVGDFVVFKRPELPAYQLAVAADDLAMGVTQVVRGDDLVPSTARQILLWRALGGGDRLPEWGHVPLVVGTDGARLAKRHGDARLRSLREQGVDPRRVIGRLAEWSGFGDGRPASPAELVGSFDRAKLDPRRLVLDAERLAGI